MQIDPVLAGPGATSGPLRVDFNNGNPCRPYSSAEAHAAFNRTMQGRAGACHRLLLPAVLNPNGDSGPRRGQEGHCRATQTVTLDMVQVMSSAWGGPCGHVLLQRVRLLAASTSLEACGHGCVARPKLLEAQEQ